MLKEIFINSMYMLGIVACFTIICNLLRRIFFPKPPQPVLPQMSDRQAEILMKEIVKQTIEKTNFDKK